MIYIKINFKIISVNAAVVAIERTMQQRNLVIKSLKFHFMKTVLISLIDSCRLMAQLISASRFIRKLKCSLFCWTFPAISVWLFTYLFMFRDSSFMLDMSSSSSALTILFQLKQSNSGGFESVFIANFHSDSADDPGLEKQI